MYICRERDICNCMQHVFLRLLEKRQGYNLIYLNVIMGIPTNHTAVCCWIFNALFVPGLREGGTLIHWAPLWSYRSKSEGTFMFSNPSQTSRGHDHFGVDFHRMPHAAAANGNIITHNSGRQRLNGADIVYST